MNRKTSRNNIRFLFPTFNILLHALILILIIWYILIPIERDTAYYASLSLSILLYGLYTKKSIPPGSITLKWNLFSILFQNPNVQYILYCSIFAIGPPVIYSLLPLAILNAFPVSDYIIQILNQFGNNKILKHVLKFLMDFKNKKEMYYSFVSFWEIIEMPLLFLYMFLGYSNILMLIAYINFLRQRSLTSPSTRLTLEILNIGVESFIRTYIPFLFSTYKKITQFIVEIIFGIRAVPKNTTQPIITEPED